jgi:hypothetical protein
MTTCSICGSPSEQTWCAKCAQWRTHTRQYTRGYSGRALADLYRTALVLLRNAARTPDGAATLCQCCGADAPQHDMLGVSLWRVCDRCHMMALSLDGDDPKQIEMNLQSVRASFLVDPRDYPKIPLIARLFEAYVSLYAPSAGGVPPPATEPTPEDAALVDAWFNAIALDDFQPSYHRRYTLGENDAK